MTQVATEHMQKLGTEMYMIVGFKLFMTVLIQTNHSQHSRTNDEASPQRIAAVPPEGHARRANTHLPIPLPTIWSRDAPE